MIFEAPLNIFPIVNALYLLQILVLLLVIGIVISITIHTVLNGISPMPSSHAARRIMMDLIKETAPKDAIADLGSGWGGLAFCIARAFPGRVVTGYENSPIPFLFAWCLQKLIGPPNLRFKCTNFFAVNMSDVGAVVCYLYPGAMTRLKTKLSEELKPVARVVSNGFAVPGWKPVRVVDVNDFYRTKVYLYEY
jgi:hypothetical protein